MYKIYIIKCYDDEELTEYERPTEATARETINTLINSTFAPTKIELYGYKDGKEYQIQL